MEHITKRIAITNLAAVMYSNFHPLWISFFIILLANQDLGGVFATSVKMVLVCASGSIVVKAFQIHSLLCGGL